MHDSWIQNGPVVWNMNINIRCFMWLVCMFNLESFIVVVLVMCKCVFSIYQVICGTNHIFLLY